MPLGKNFFAGRSELTRVPQSVTVDTESVPASRVHALRLPPNTRQAATRERPGSRPCEFVPAKGAPRRFVLTAGFDLISRAATRCAIFADLAFTNFPVAALSWLMTQFFVGCAAYAEAMYPSAGYAGSNDTLHQSSPAESERAGSDHVGFSPRLAPELKELSGFAIDAEPRQSPSPPIQAGPAAAETGGNGNIVWLNATRKTPSRRLASTALFVTNWLSRRRRSAPERAVTVELGSYDCRTPRGAAMPRYGIE
jgi:hypothetical protein